jgi:hypothetical protein
MLPFIITLIYLSPLASRQSLLSSIILYSKIPNDLLGVLLPPFPVIADLSSILFPQTTLVISEGLTERAFPLLAEPIETPSSFLPDKVQTRQFPTNVFGSLPTDGVDSELSGLGP